MITFFGVITFGRSITQWVLGCLVRNSFYTFWVRHLDCGDFGWRIWFYCHFDDTFVVARSGCSLWVAMMIHLSHGVEWLQTVWSCESYFKHLGIAPRLAARSRCIRRRHCLVLGIKCALGVISRRNAILHLPQDLMEAAQAGGSVSVEFGRTSSCRCVVVRLSPGARWRFVSSLGNFGIHCDAGISAVNCFATLIYSKWRDSVTYAEPSGWCDVIALFGVGGHVVTEWLQNVAVMPCWVTRPVAFRFRFNSAGVCH